MWSCHTRSRFMGPTGRRLPHCSLQCICDDRPASLSPSLICRCLHSALQLAVARLHAPSLDAHHPPAVSASVPCSGARPAAGGASCQPPAGAQRSGRPGDAAAGRAAAHHWHSSVPCLSVGLRQRAEAQGTSHGCRGMAGAGCELACFDVFLILQCVLDWCQ